MLKWGVNIALIYSMGIVSYFYKDKGCKKYGKALLQYWNHSFPETRI